MWRRVDLVRTNVSEERWFLALGFFYSEDECDTFLRNVGSTRPDIPKTAFFIVTVVKTSNPYTYGESSPAFELTL
jgi:hypothetical protein